ncbi:phosphatase PAP2 family protein [candidate division KSB1 bacterium]|nr:phosphatase PAP2 family protein [candidate division KSB1 bacterium]
MFKKIWQQRYGSVHWRLADLLAIGYMAALAVLLPFFHHHVPNWPKEVCIHLAFVFAGIEIVRAGERHPGNRVLWFLRTFYPLATIFYGYFEMNHMNRMFSGSYWAMEALIELDAWLFGAHPTVWVQRLYSPGLDELMNFFYVSYYSFAPLATLPLFLRGKREETLAVFGIVTLSYVGNFVLFYAFPSLCPRMIPELEALRTRDYSGYFIASLTKYFQSEGAISGGCFPSTHVSGAMAWSLATWRYNRKLSYVMLPLALGVALATVYLGYHHALDPIVGILWAGMAYGIAGFIFKKRGEGELRNGATAR